MLVCVNHFFQNSAFFVTANELNFTSCFALLQVCIMKANDRG